MHEDEIGTGVVDCAVRLHMELGPGLLEAVYEFALAHRLRQRGLRVGRQIGIPIQFDGLSFDQGFRADLLVEDRVIVEIKCVERVHPAHKKQLLTYLRLSDRRLGYVLNFGAATMKEGITRIIHSAGGVGRAADSLHPDETARGLHSQLGDER
jgi:GxxExxY protein